MYDRGIAGIAARITESVNMPKRKQSVQRTLPGHFYVIRLKNKLVGPFLSMTELDDWTATNCIDAAEVWSMFAPITGEMNKGHEVGHIVQTVS